MRNTISRRDLLQWMLLAAAGTQVGPSALGSTEVLGKASPHPTLSGQRIKDTTYAFIATCARPDGGYSPSPDPHYLGFADTMVSDLAAVTYAATLAKSEGWELPDKECAADFVQRHQQPDGVFVNLQGSYDPKSYLAIQYNTVQGVVALRALGRKPKIDPVHVMDRFFKGEAFKKLPLFRASFFPLFYAALGVPFPPAYKQALKQWLIQSQGPDGFLLKQVPSTFHLVHFFRLIGEPTPKASSIVRQILQEQQPDGGWNIPNTPAAHACFDAVFVLRQIGGGSAACHAAIHRAADWAFSCRNPDGGFGEFPGWHSDMDAVYFKFGTLIQAGRIPGSNFNLPDAETLSWGHAMKPGKIYRTA